MLTYWSYQQIISHRLIKSILPQTANRALRTAPKTGSPSGSPCLCRKGLNEAKSNLDPISLSSIRSPNAETRNPQLKPSSTKIEYFNKTICTNIEQTLKCVIVRRTSRKSTSMVEVRVPRCVRKSESQTERQREREKERARDRERERKTDTETETETERERERESPVNAPQSVP